MTARQLFALIVAIALIAAGAAWLFHGHTEWLRECAARGASKWECEARYRAGDTLPGTRK